MKNINIFSGYLTNPGGTSKVIVIETNVSKRNHKQIQWTFIVI